MCPLERLTQQPCEHGLERLQGRPETKYGPDKGNMVQTKAGRVGMRKRQTQQGLPPGCGQQDRAKNQDQSSFLAWTTEYIQQDRKYRKDGKEFGAKRWFLVNLSQVLWDKKEVRKGQVGDLSLKYGIQTSGEIGLVATDQEGQME